MQEVIIAETKINSIWHFIAVYPGIFNVRQWFVYCHQFPSDTQGVQEEEERVPTPEKNVRDKANNIADVVGISNHFSDTPAREVQEYTGAFLGRWNLDCDSPEDKQPGENLETS